MKRGLRSWCWRKLIEWMQPPMEIKKYAVARRDFAPEIERKMLREIRRQIRQTSWGLNVKFETATSHQSGTT